jgi:hypothetical protein
MRWPRKGILIRLLIYLPILGYLSWRVLAAREPAEAPVDPAQSYPKRTFTTEDGKTFEVLEVTPEQAEKMMGRPLPAPEAEQD